MTNIHRDKRVLVLPDIHQDLPWATEVMAKEHDGRPNSELVFLGDFFDTFKKDLPSVKVVSIWLNEVLEAANAHAIVGNHDAQYLYDWRRYQMSGRISPRMGNPLQCSGYSRSKAEKIARTLARATVARLEPFLMIHDKWLASHAGMSPKLFPPLLTDAETLLSAYTSLKRDLVEIDTDSPLFYCGRARQGHDPYSGPTWRDWNREFDDNLPWRQIVGHTARGKRLDDDGVARRGRSVCIDNGQTTYGIIENGEFTQHTL